ncbi:MAG: hypothetical protein M1831_006081 [Alyxoria varia]|nr:MAG: hypothetical protein M1831_006081 [Alyxoria varia]
MAKKHKRQKHQYHQAPQKISSPSFKPSNNNPTKSSKQASKNKKKQAGSHPARRRAMEVPFGAEDDLLLVGEGDFSFAQSLALHHRTNFRHLHATTLDTRAELLAKHPQAEGHIDAVLAAGSKEDTQEKEHDVGDNEGKEQTEAGAQEQDSTRLAQDEDQEVQVPDEEQKQERDEQPSSNAQTQSTRISYTIDATRLPTYKPLRTHRNPMNQQRLLKHSTKTTATTSGKNPQHRNGTQEDGERPAKKRRKTTQDAGTGWDWIIFNFPHVGGKSTDVRRQVRANQEMLVRFFEGAKEILYRAPVPKRRSAGAANKAGGASKLSRTNGYSSSSAGHNRQHSDGASDLADEDQEEEQETQTTKGKDGRLMITLFEGEPYTLWNIRDLARHCGYGVERSYRFEWEVFGGYQHARTFGNVVSRSRDSGDGKGNTDADADVVEDAGNEEDVEADAVEHGRKEEDVNADAEWNGRSADEHEHQQHPEVEKPRDGKRPGKWRGEDRDARSYVFYVKREDQNAANGAGAGAGKKVGGAPGSKRPKGYESDGSDD